MTTTRRLTLTLAAVLATALAAGCAGGSAGPSTAASGGGAAKVLFLGDSVAAGEALAVGAALEAGGVGFRSLASDGGGNVVGPFTGKRWRTLPQEIAGADPTVVVYQLTTYDWGTRAQQRAAYERLAATVGEAGATLVLVSGPPIRPDDFYRPHMAQLRAAPEVAREVARRSNGRVVALDASAVWGAEYRRTRDGAADRSTDGVHACPQGAARFAAWLVDELAGRFPGFAPAPPEAWANAGWSADARFKGC